MKGLLIKDYRLLLQQRYFFTVICLMMLAYMFLFDAIFSICFVTIIFANYTISTIAYDDFEGGMAFIFTLPITKKEYVNEKYVYAVLNAGAASIISTLIAVITSAVRQKPMGGVEIITCIIMACCMAVLMLTFGIPVQLKFGAERGRIATVGVVVAILAVVYIVKWVFERMGVRLQEIEAWIDKQNMILVLGIFVILVVMLVLISKIISLKILNAKEF